MAQVTLNELSTLKPGGMVQGSAGGNFWTPQSIEKILSGVKDLLIEYQKVRGIVSAGNGHVEPGPAVMMSKHGDMNPPGAVPGLTWANLTEFGKRLCDELAKQGYGDKTALEVLTDFKFTINQIKGMIP